MDFEVKITTPGSYLSTRTLFGIISELNKSFEIGTINALKDLFPLSSNSQIRKFVSGKLDFNIVDAKKGSWELYLVGAIGGVVGKAIYDLSMDVIKTSPQWKGFKERVFKPSRKIAEEISEKLDDKEKLGPFLIETQSLVIETSSNGATKLKYEVVLIKNGDLPSLLTTENQVNHLIEEITQGRKAHS